VRSRPETAATDRERERVRLVTGLSESFLSCHRGASQWHRAE